MQTIIKVMSVIGLVAFSIGVLVVSRTMLFNKMHFSVYPDEYTIVRDEQGKILYQLHTISRKTINIVQSGGRRLLIIPPQNDRDSKKILLEPGWTVEQMNDMDFPPE